MIDIDVDREISQRGVKLAGLDLRELRVRYSRTLSVPMYRATNLKRSFIVQKLLEVEFGDAYTEYESRASKWRELEQQAVNAWTSDVEQNYDAVDSTNE